MTTMTLTSMMAMVLEVMVVMEMARIRTVVGVVTKLSGESDDGRDNDEW